jgi:hypothetical protein
VNLQKTFMKSILATGVILLIGGFTTAISYGQATTSTEKFTLTLVGIDNSCGPTPEFVSLTGDVNVIVHFTIDAAGGVHVLDAHNNIQNGKGVGEITGTKYVVTSASVENLFNIEQTSVNEFTAFFHVRLLSQGGQPNQLGNFQVHFTIHPDGKITGEVDKPAEFICR